MTLLERTRRRAARSLAVERGWPELLPAVAALCAFAVLAELALPQALPLWLQVVVVLGLAVYAASRIWHVLRRLPTPQAAAIDRRIEQRSGLAHRPLQTLADRPAGVADPASHAAWQAHRARTLQRLDRLRAGAPRPGLWRYPAGRLTVGLLAALALSWTLAGVGGGMRLASGFLPGLFALPGPAPRMQAWITPPLYAGSAPVFLADPRGESTVASGSVLQVSLTGLEAAPRLSIRGLEAAAAGTPHFVRLAPGSWSLQTTLDRGIHLSLRGNGRRLADWTLRVTKLPPSLVAWDGKPGPSRQAWRTRLPWRVSDPYGVTRLDAMIRLAQPQAGTQRDGAPTPLGVPIPIAPDTRQDHGVALPDLTADPRAGEAVVADLTATDRAGHRLRSSEQRFTLPERRFRSPLARAVLDTRKRLALGRETRVEAADDLEALGGAPGQFADDSGLFLNLVAVAALLRDEDAPDRSAIDETTNRLWELALALEDGLHNDRDVARANTDVRAAQQAVTAQLQHMRALGGKGQSPAEQSELQRRIEALSAAIARKMQALAQEAARAHTVLPPMPDARMLSGRDLARMLRQMRDDAAHGDTGAAMRKLAQMQAMLDHMRAATPQDLQQAQAQAQAQREAREQTEGLRDLIAREAALLDQTQARRTARARAESAQAPPGVDPQTAELLRRLGIPPGDLEGDPGAPPAAPPETPPETPAIRTDRHQEAQVQHALARALGGLGEEFRALTGKQPGGFETARRDMDTARQALSSGHDQPAQQAQQQALAALQKGGQQMQQMLSSGSGASAMLMPGMGSSGGEAPDQDAAEGSEPSGPRDPLGRPVASGPQDDDGDTHVPDKFQQLRARAIENELRKRDSDRTRPAQELDYLGRLLKPF